MATYHNRKLVSGKTFLIWAKAILIFMMFISSQTFAMKMTSPDSITLISEASEIPRTLFGINITNKGYGGVIFKLSSFNNQFAFMTGGRGAITFNDRYTIGGGGYGIANSIIISGTSEETNRLFKMGYGGIELGYIILPGKKMNIGVSLLFAGGAAFWQTKPKSEGEKLLDDDFKIIPVLEPSLYSEIALNRFMWLHAGISYRYVHHANLDYMTDQNMRGFSCYLGLLFGKQ